jgi:hypothetical protein
MEEQNGARHKNFSTQRQSIEMQFLLTTKIVFFGMVVKLGKEQSLIVIVISNTGNKRNNQTLGTVELLTSQYVTVSVVGHSRPCWIESVSRE